MFAAASSPSEDPERELRWLRCVRELCEELASAREPAQLLERILDAALRLTGAERAFLVRVADGGRRVRVEAARGFCGAELASEAGRVSRRVVERTLARRTGVLTSTEDDAELLSLTSVAGERIRSIACVPLLLRGEPWGVLYLDHRVRPGLLCADDLRVLRTFADQCVLALLASGGSRWTPPPSPALERFAGLVGRSPGMRSLYQALELGARREDPALVAGEAGSGKERVARALHALGPGPEEPFLTLSCAGCEPGELARLLFGGCGQRGRPAEAGALRRARRGTLYLRALQAAPAALQERLDAALRSGRARPLGAGPSYPIACRVVGGALEGRGGLSASQSLDARLYHRLALVRLRVPPLRERLVDLPLLVASLADELGTSLAVSAEALRLLEAHSWPGNVRELRNEVERWVASGVQRVTPGILSAELRPRDSLGAEGLRALLREVGGNKAEAARRLGLARSTFYGLLRRHGVR
ncbi:MAG: sigma-54-dependent Fis family transcriptional regulator [Planctomycetota bacterium]|nr:MAG: sigma-54-dependent Fis family transcriptional regulator [Planctomycetota bacterium]